MRISDWSSDVCSSDLASIRSINEDRSSRIAGLPSGQFGEKLPGLVIVVKLEAVVATRLHPPSALAFGPRECVIIEDDERRLAITLKPVVYLGWSRAIGPVVGPPVRSEEHTSELQSLMRISYAVFCL